MPYIPYKRRDELDPLILPLTMFPAEDEKTDGEINYVITRIIDGVYSKGNYFKYERVIGLLECIKLELYRRRVAEYENLKRLENGDVFL